jgi:hypothetical protein
MVAGKKHVESVPAEWIDAVRPAVDAARGFKDAVSELFAINAHGSLPVDFVALR